MKERLELTRYIAPLFALTAVFFSVLETQLMAIHINGRLTQEPPTAWYGNIYRCVINGSQFSTEYQLKFAVKWTGFFGDDWEGTYNWDCGILPDENTDVIIKADQYQFPVIGSNAVCRSLILEPGAKLTIKSWGNLQVKKQN
jgi:hypothetical protein